MRIHRPKIKRQKQRGFIDTISEKEILQILMEWGAICLLIAWLFYDAWQAVLLLFPGVVLWMRFRKESFRKKRKLRYAAEFQEGLAALASSMSAGFSPEAAVTEALKDLRMMHEKDNAMMEELKRMTGQLSMNRNIEELFYEMAQRSGLADAVSLAEVFRAARRTGGNLPGILEEAAAVMEDKEMVNQEIEVLLAGKRYEQRIMVLIPFAMILYLRFGSPGYLDPFYHSAAGICIMTLCLGIYGIAVYMGDQVMKIEI